MAKKIQLTEKMRRYCELVVLENLSYADAYAQSYNTENMARSTIRRNAVELNKHPKVKEYMAELTEMVLMESRDVHTKLMIFYLETMQNGELPLKERIKAGEVLAKLYGLLSDNVNIGAKDDNSINITISTPDDEKE